MRNADSPSSRGHPEPSTRDLVHAGSLSSSTHSNDSPVGFLDNPEKQTDSSRRAFLGYLGLSRPPTLRVGEAPSLRTPLPILLKVQDTSPRCATEKMRSSLGALQTEGNKGRTRGATGALAGGGAGCRAADSGDRRLPAVWGPGQAAAPAAKLRWRKEAAEAGLSQDGTPRLRDSQPPQKTLGCRRGLGVPGNLG